MEIIKGDMLEGIWDCAFHCANVHKVMGSGVALYLSRKWPEVSTADNLFGPQENDRLGKFSRAELPDGRSVYNLYGQVGVGNDGHPLKRNCSYDHLYNALYKACNDIELLYDIHETGYFRTVEIGIPYGMAACRAGGSWPIIECMLNEMEERFDVHFTVFDIENGEMKKPAQSSVNID